MISSLWFGIWVTLFRFEFEYAGLNVGKNKFGLNFFIWNMQAWTAKINLGFKFFFWLGHELGPIPKRGLRDPWDPAGAGPGPWKKPGTLNGSGPGHRSCPASRVHVWKNPARTRPVAIPNDHAMSPWLGIGVPMNNPHWFGYQNTNEQPPLVWVSEYQWITPIGLGIRIPMNDPHWFRYQSTNERPSLVWVSEYQWITPIGWVSEYQ